jgi:hypothetical protein
VLPAPHSQRLDSLHLNTSLRVCDSPLWPDDLTTFLCDFLPFYY